MRARERNFSTLLANWVNDSGGVDVFLESTALKDVLPESDVTELMTGQKTPSRELANYLSALMPAEIISEQFMRVHANQAANDRAKPKITLTDEQFHKARVSILRRIADDGTKINSSQGEEAISFDAKRRLGRVINFLRLTEGKSHRDMEREAGCGRGMFREYESGICSPPPDRMSKILEICHADKKACQATIDLLCTRMRRKPATNRRIEPKLAAGFTGSCETAANSEPPVR